MYVFARVLASIALVGCGTSQAHQIYDSFPDAIEPEARYVIYSHGLIVDGDDPRPVSPSFGVYEFPEIKQALFAGGGFNLIADHRPADTDFVSYVDTLESWVRALVDAGVAPSHITLVGFSRGGQLTAFASSRLRDVGINTALLAACVEGDVHGEPRPILGGHVLSIYETSDVAGPCSELAARSADLVSFEEVAISTGRSHGAFFKPLNEWLRPLRHWIGETNRSE